MDTDVYTWMQIQANKHTFMSNKQTNKMFDLNYNIQQTGTCIHTC